MLGTSTSAPSTLQGPFYFLPAPSILDQTNAFQHISLGSLSTVSCDPRHLTCLSHLKLGLWSEVDMLRPCTEVTLEVTQTSALPLPLSDLRTKLEVSVTEIQDEPGAKGRNESCSTTALQVRDPSRLIFSFSPDQTGLFKVSVMLEGHHIQASPLLLPILSDENKSSVLKNLGLARVNQVRFPVRTLPRVNPAHKNVLQEKMKDEESSNTRSVFSEVEPSRSNSKIEDLKALMDRELLLEKKESSSAEIGESGLNSTQKMVLEYELLRRLETLGVKNKPLEEEFDVKRVDQLKPDCRDEVKKEQRLVQDLSFGGEVVVKKVTPKKRPDQVLYQPPFFRQSNNSGVGRGRAMPLPGIQVQRMSKEGVSEVVQCKDTTKLAGRGNFIERVNKRRPDGEMARGDQGPRVESIKYQDVQQGVKREKMVRKSPVKEEVEDHQAPSERQLVLHQGSGDRKYEFNEKVEREEYWRKLEYQGGAANNRGKKAERGSAEEARQAGARRRATASNAGRHLTEKGQKNAQGLAQYGQSWQIVRRIEDLKIQLAIIGRSQLINPPSLLWPL